MSRVSKVQAKLKDQDLGGLLVTSPFNLRYLSNFTGTTGLSLITQDKAYFITDFRYTEQANEQASHMTVIEHSGDIIGQVGDLLRQDGIQNLAFEQDHVTYSLYQEMKEKLPADLKAESGLVERLRMIKDPQELATIKEAVKITEAAFRHILDYIEEGMTEIQVANELDFFMRSKGASGVSFDTIVASGKRSAMPHGVASDKKIERGDMITIDFGCYYKGYASDMTRTFALGDPGDKLKEIYQIVYEANRLAAQAAKPGISGAELDKVARDHIAQAGYGDQFGHTLGHSIGLDVHEDPVLSKRNPEPLQANMVVTNEPGIYLPGLGGVRIEDDLIITEDGNEELMTVTRELIIL